MRPRDEWNSHLCCHTSLEQGAFLSSRWRVHSYLFGFITGCKRYCTKEGILIVSWPHAWPCVFFKLAHSLTATTSISWSWCLQDPGWCHHTNNESAWVSSLGFLLHDSPQNVQSCCHLHRPISILQLTRGPVFNYQQNSDLSRRIVPGFSTCTTRIIGESANNWQTDNSGFWVKDLPTTEWFTPFSLPITFVTNFYSTI